VRYFNPVLNALRELGGSGTPQEVQRVVAGNLQIADDEQSRLTKGGQPSKNLKSRVRKLRRRRGVLAIVKNCSRLSAAFRLPASRSSANDSYASPDVRK